MEMREHSAPNTLGKVLLLHGILIFCVITLGDTYNFSTLAVLLYVIICAFSFSTARKLAASPIDVIGDFLGTWHYIIFVACGVYAVLLVIEHQNNSAIWELVTFSLGTLLTLISMFVCPVAAGLTLQKLLQAVSK